MICPHCGIGIDVDWYEESFPSREDSTIYSLQYETCPVCGKAIVLLIHGMKAGNIEGPFLKVYENEVIYPTHTCGRALDQSIPEKYASIFRESEQVNDISPRASATLSRYLLQMILHEELNIKGRNLEIELDKLAELDRVPSNLIVMLQVMRKVANFGAHPKKSTNCGEIVEIENGESDIMLDLLEELFDFIFVKPKQKQDFLKTAEEKYGIKLDS